MKKQSKLTDMEQLEYEYYQNHRFYLVGQKHKEEASLFKTLILISSGVFSLSIAFPNLSDVICKCLLITSWIFSSLALFIMIIGINCSIKAYETEIQCWDKTKKSCNTNTASDWVCYTKMISILLLFLSVVFLIIFYSINL